MWQRVTSEASLQAAWYRVKANGGGAGGDLVGPGDFQRDLFANLTQLRAELLGGTYRTGPFRKVSIPKKKPGYRILTIPSIRDRVVHTSIAAALTPILEAVFEDGSFAYRPGRGVVHAVERIELWRRRGYDVVIEADIVSYFDNIDQEILLAKLQPLLEPLPGSAAVLALVARILADEGRALETPGRGLVQGSPLSPLLANLYLDALDEEIEALGVKIVRFADDFVILCKSERKAAKALQRCAEVLGAHGLKLHDAGTRVVSFERGFDFIGYLFLRTLALQQKPDTAVPRPSPVKSQVTDEGVIELEGAGSRFDPGARVLYVLDPAHSLSTRNRSFSVLREDGSELIAIPHGRVGRIELAPGVSFPRNVLDLALETSTELVLLDGIGQTRGYVQSSSRRQAGLLLAQAAVCLDASLAAAFARKIVDARLRNQRAQLSRLNRSCGDEGVKQALEAMARHLRKLGQADTIEVLRGIEGAATAAYWPALASLLDTPPQAPFRRTRPAVDRINAAINYLTAILERDTRAAIQAVGLHPGMACLHASKDRHDGLVYDLMEPFRAPLTEGLVVYLCNARRLRPEMAEIAADGSVFISTAGREALILAYETAVARRVNRPDGGGKLSWRAMMRFQAQRLAEAMRARDPSLFHPYLMEV